ncbi:MAG: hypothetical protein PHN18_03775 [Sulfurospirillaceae bacterium]|nr:hypothetical protein [Sulfurospirillaceae bacterium]MDD2825472.1 hypothetical protein [Sulfurospirillaceae bacterium]
MDNDIKVLEKIGLQEVCKKTHIEVKQLEYMINNQYEKLNKINTVGFVKIISREYKLDLSDWLEGFYEYWYDNKVEEDAKKEKIFVRAKSERSYKRVVWAILLIFLISGIVAVFSIFKIDIDLASLINKTKVDVQIAGYQSAPVVQEAAKTLGVKVEERVVDSNSSNVTVETIIVPIDFNGSKKTDTNTSVDNEVNQSIETVIIKSSATVPLSEEKNSSKLTAQLPKTRAIIVPTRKIWVGIISLDNFNRTVTSNEDNITIDLTKKQLIKTGNGFFRLVYDGSVEDFIEQGSTRFLVDQGSIKKISEEKFIELNRGKNW